MPGIAWWLGRLPAGEVREQFISAHDLHPSFRALAGLPPSADPRKVGQNFWPSIERNAAIERRNPIVLGLALRELSTALIQDGWKLVRALQFNLMAAPAEQIGEVARQELYNLIEDPRETEDLAARHPERLAQLAALMDAVSLGLAHRRRPAAEGLDRSDLPPPRNRTTPNPAKPPRRKRRRCAPPPEHGASPHISEVGIGLALPRPLPLTRFRQRTMAMPRLAKTRRFQWIARHQKRRADL